MKTKTSRSLSTAIYVRVSTEEQAQEGYSIRAQIEKLKSYALLKEWDIFDVYADEGISGKNIIDRPQVNRLIQDIEDGNVNNVLVFKVDRLTRNTKNLIELVDLFDENKCAFNSLCESIDTDTPSGRMFLKIIGIFAEFERENISERVRLGKERMVKEGYTLANYSMSYGYTKDKGEKVQQIDKTEAKIVKEIFNMFVEKNMSMTGIAAALNNRKIPTKRNALYWDARTIKFILTNPTYIGKVRYNITDEERYFEAEGHHKRIISDKIYNMAQNKINNMPTYLKTKKPKDESYYCGVLFCGVCGSKYTTHNCSFKRGINGEKVRQTSYKCNRRAHHKGEASCTNCNISHFKMEMAFVEYIKTLHDLHSVGNINIENNVHDDKILMEAINSNEKQVNDLLNRKKQIMEKYVAGSIEFDDYKSMLEVHNQKLEALDEEISSQKENLSKSQELTVLPNDLITNIRENWAYLADRERMIFMQRFVKKIVINVEKERKNSNIVHITNVEFHDGGTLLEAMKN